MSGIRWLVIYCVFALQIEQLSCLSLAQSNIGNYLRLGTQFVEQGFTHIEPVALEKYKSVRFTFYNNRLRVLPQDLFSHNDRFEVLLFQNNLISEIAPRTFAALTNLTVIDLSGNQLQEISEDLFNGNLRLANIYLHRNQLHTIHPRSFERLTRLATLYIDHNRLKTLDLHLLFPARTSLTRLFAAKNELEDIEYQELADNFVNFKSISLTENPFKCSLATAMTTYFEKKDIQVYDEFWWPNSNISCTADDRGNQIE